MTRTLTGIVHGKTIELEQDPGVADGQQVELQLTVPATDEPWGAAIRRTAGALVDDSDWDRIMQELHGARKLVRPTSVDLK
jgi:hypothetical protein